MNELRVILDFIAVIIYFNAVYWQFRRYPLSFKRFLESMGKPMTWQLSTSVLISEVPPEAVLLNTQTGNCFVLDPLGLAICKLIEINCELPEIIEYLQGQFPDAMDQISQDVPEFITVLQSEGLIQQISR